MQISAKSRGNLEVKHTERTVITDWILRAATDDGGTSVEGSKPPTRVVLWTQRRRH